MLDKNLQDALARLDKSVPKRRFNILPFLAVIFFSVFILGFGIWGYQNVIPQISEKDINRMIVVASRSGQADPVRLLFDMESYMGKKMNNFNIIERAEAIEFLLEYIKFQKDSAQMIVY